ncbi:MAG: DUF4386 domain-containing protein [Melioribacteraceae bacterium]|nr:DUF4386 domain-containing protein [Melioribacteraceae bacterium]MCF8265550.1 DUF4386 domain-containing protein [Melioribacteraceae bacterium]
MSLRKLSLITGISYLIIFFAAIFANFLALESLKLNPVETILENHLMVRLGIMAFMITVVFDVVVAWTLNEIFREHIFSKLSTYFRMMHAAIMGAAVFALPITLNLTSASEILHQVEIFNTIWLIGLFFFGIHLILLSRMFQKPKFISLFLAIAGSLYILDTTAHFVFPDYKSYASIFLTIVAIPSIVGEMSFAIWMLLKGGKE